VLQVCLHQIFTCHWYSGSPTDWTKQCPIPSDLPFEVLMIDMNSSAPLSKFVHLWTFDAENNWSILKTID
jgi:hypothetical protein